MSPAALKHMKMKVKRGLNRLFVVFMFGWYAFASLVLWPLWKNSIGIPISAISAVRQGVPNPPLGFTMRPFRTDDGKYLCYESNSPTSKPWEKYRCYPASGDLPSSFIPDDPPQKPIAQTAFFVLLPAVLYAIGLSAAWVFRGFRADVEP